MGGTTCVACVFVCVCACVRACCHFFAFFLLWFLLWHFFFYFYTSKRHMFHALEKVISPTYDVCVFAAVLATMRSSCFAACPLRGLRLARVRRLRRWHSSVFFSYFSQQRSLFSVRTCDLGHISPLTQLSSSPLLPPLPLARSTLFRQEPCFWRAQRHPLLPVPCRKPGGPQGHVGGGADRARGDLRDVRLVHRGEDPQAGEMRWTPFSIVLGGCLIS